MADRSFDQHTLIQDVMEEVVEVPSSSIVSKTLYRDKSTRAILFAFAPGQSLSEHTSPTSAILHFLEGEATVTLGSEVVTARGGTWVHMPPHLPHSIEATTTVRMLLYMLTT